MRCFIGIELPLEIKEVLSLLQEEVGNEFAKIKWVEKKNLHITLKFLGEIDEKEVELLKEALGNIKFRKFEVYLDKLGWYPNDFRINTIWIGLEPEKYLLGLHGGIELKLGSLFQKDERFSVHVTLGRVKFIKNKEKFLDTLKSLKVKKESFYVGDFSLIKSELTKDGPKYAVLKRYDLG